MSLVKQARAAWFLAAVWAVGATPAHAQPRRGGNRAAAQQQQAAEDGEVPTVPVSYTNLTLPTNREG